MDDEQIKVIEADGIVTITLNRPDRLNAFVGHMRRDLAEALEEAGSDPHVRVVVIKGEGRAFCAGGDVQFMADMLERRDGEEFSRILGAARRVILAIRQMTKPVIASIEGPASGAGFNLALACDLRVASRTATFSQSFVKLGFHPDWGGTYFLPRMVTSNIACELFFLGDTIDANEAFRLGLINRIVAPEELEAETQKLSAKLAALNGQLAEVEATRRREVDAVTLQKVANDARAEQERLAAAELASKDDFLANQRVSAYMKTLKLRKNENP